MENTKIGEVFNDVDRLITTIEYPVHGNMLLGLKYTYEYKHIRDMYDFMMTSKIDTGKVSQYITQKYGIHDRYGIRAILRVYGHLLGKEILKRMDFDHEEVDFDYYSYIDFHFMRDRLKITEPDKKEVFNWDE
jgi:hypothetical protein